MKFCLGRLATYESGKEGLLACAWRVEIIEIPPRILFSTKFYMSLSVMSCRSTRDILRACVYSESEHGLPENLLKNASCGGNSVSSNISKLSI